MPATHTLFLVTCLTLQSAYLPPRPVEPRTRDLLFVEAQEEWVAEILHPHRTADVLPLRQARLVMMLGSAEYQTRAFAGVELAAQGDDAAQALYWGRRATDPEIRERCEMLWDRLFLCPDCRGEGRRECKTDYGFVYTADCSRCGKSGDLRTDCVWDSDASDYKPQERRVDRAIAWEPPKD